MIKIKHISEMYLVTLAHEAFPCEKFKSKTRILVEQLTLIWQKKIQSFPD